MFTRSFVSSRPALFVFSRSAQPEPTVSGSVARAWRRALAPVALAGVLTVSGCATGTNTASTGHSTAATPEASAAAEGEDVRLAVESPWVKASTRGEMTAVFATLSNEGSEPVVLTGATAPGVASMVQLHETVADPATGATVMQEMAEPITIDPGAFYVLEPGADHIMLMDLQCGLYAGDDTEIVLSFADGSTQTITTPIRDYAGAQEEYAPGEHEAPTHSGAQDEEPTGEDHAEHDPSGHEDSADAELASCHE